MPTATTTAEELKQLLSTKDFVKIPKEGETVRGTVIAISPREILIDLEGYKTGVIRGMERREKESAYPNLKIGDQIEATVLELENEEGTVELAFQFTGKVRGYEAAVATRQSGTTVEVKVVEANRGGLMVTWNELAGFIPVSQLAPEHYPRVPGGDKGKILERLRTFVGQTLPVKVLDCDPNEDKLIFSEKTLWEEEQKDLLARYKVGEMVEGTVTAIAEFGVFVGFSAEGGSPPKDGQAASGGDKLEGLVHISEIAWQRIDNPGDLVKVGDKVRAQILNIQGSKIFLSMKALMGDPWKKVQERYTVGQTVEARVLKVNPFGLFVELDPEIHGLAHVSELVVQAGVPLEQQIKPGDTRTLKVVSIEPEHHRLGLSEKALKKEPEPAPISAEQKLQSGGVAEEATPVV